jgi:multiple sugar transport system substrate-binding protein
MQDTDKQSSAGKPSPHPVTDSGINSSTAVSGRPTGDQVLQNKIPQDNVSSENNVLQEQVDTRLQNALTDPVENTSVSPNTQNTPSLTQDKSGKKGGLKMLLFFVFFFLILGVLMFLFIKFRETGTILLGNKGEIVWWGVQHDLSVYKPLIDEFEKENPNIKIRYEKQSTKDYRIRLANALSSGAGPDIFEIHNTWPAMFRNELSVLPGSVMTNEEFAGSFYPIIVSDSTLEKGIVAMPLEYDALTLFINENVFTSALKSPPETWTDFQGLASDLTQTGDRRVILQGGAAIGITENVDHWPEIFGLMLFQNRINPARPIGTLASDVFSFYTLFSKNRVWDNTLPRSTEAFSRGELAMYFGPTRRASEITRLNPNLKFRTVKLPQLAKNKANDPNYSYATYWLQGVAEKSKVKEGAWTFLKFLSRADSLGKLNENIIKAETLGRVYPRPDMNIEKAQDPILGSIIVFAYDAKSFYLADNTFDGESGINSQVNNTYKGLIDDWSRAREKDLETLSQELIQILGKFGIRVR